MAYCGETAATKMLDEPGQAAVVRDLDDLRGQGFRIADHGVSPSA